DPLADFLGVSRISSADTSFTWSNRTNSMSIVTGGQLPIFADKDETLKALASPEFNPRATVYLPLAARRVVNITNQTHVQITMRNFSAQQIELDAQADAPAMVVIAQAFYEPWHAYVDGRRVPLWQANAAFQALEVPAGKHQVTVMYEDTIFKAGAVISLGTLLATGLSWIGLGRRRKS
ncbi:MAG TPA: YfhO family protein, partial [Verrucomicrobiae bacterium]|nr:YfhO family protein [Verrucomicrobiae bacterium]